jgi:SAM-dependent methyltransferase
MSATYDKIGGTYSRQRRPDPRIAAMIRAAVGDADTAVNVGAGTGSYEPADLRVIAVEPSAVMLAQRPPHSAPAVQATAEALPFDDGTFDVALAVLTIHHWSDQRRGLEECARVARRRVVLFTWDPDSSGFWLMQEYLPETLALDRRLFPSVAEIADVIGALEVQPVLIPADCMDGFLGSFWRRPEAYLDAAIRGGMSSFSIIRDAEQGLARLESDLDSGMWKQRHRDLLDRDALDIGYRILVADLSARGAAR